MKAVITFMSLVMLMLFASVASAQDKKKTFQEVYTGTFVTMNGPMRSTGFNLSIKDFTDDAETQRYLGILAEGEQDDLLKVIRDNDLGRLSATGTVGRPLLVVRKTQLPDGRIRIVAAFERWQTIAELRSGGRLQDYPFGIM
ncbi:MAG TPA: hypothetical protein VKD91_15395, partial [Pyrinomonadaceae bacterium]|nr:hypothetical protein [Pyrinomonadaceae bacterium]